GARPQLPARELRPLPPVRWGWRAGGAGTGLRQAPERDRDPRRPPAAGRFRHPRRPDRGTRGARAERPVLPDGEVRPRSDATPRLRVPGLAGVRLDRTVDLRTGTPDATTDRPEGSRRRRATAFVPNDGSSVRPGGRIGFADPG